MKRTNMANLLSNRGVAAGDSVLARHPEWMRRGEATFCAWIIQGEQPMEGLLSPCSGKIHGATMNLLPR